MYLEPLEPGQEFSFEETVYAAEFPGVDRSLFLPVSAKFYGSHSGRWCEIQPGTRLIVQDELYIAIGDTWCVTARLPEMKCNLSFSQRVGEEALRAFFPSYMWDSKQERSLAVFEVRWPEPSPESLVVQVRVLSRWPEGWTLGRRYSLNSIHWQKCEELGRMPLEQGLSLALEWLGRHLDDPAAALRERGFEV